MKINAILVGFGLIHALYVPCAFGWVYRCATPEGAVEFRDKPCLNSLQNSEILKFDPLENIQQAPKVSIKEPSSKDAEKILKKQIQQQKKAEQALLKAKRREARCLKTQEKTKATQQALRAGCKLSRCNRLKEELRHLEIMKERNCTP